ncbi:MAG: hypothetical protein WC391_09985 [Methanoregula sp.]|jgi:hypothetical protein
MIADKMCIWCARWDRCEVSIRQWNKALEMHPGKSKEASFQRMEIMGKLAEQCTEREPIL